MFDLATLSARLSAGQDLGADEVGDAAQALARPEVPDAAKAAFLTAFSAKGETAMEETFHYLYAEMPDVLALQMERRSE